MENYEIYQKRTDYQVTVQKVSPGTKVHNFLENADYTTDEKRCFVITGTVGEQWPVNEEKLLKTYNLQPSDLNGLLPDVSSVQASPLPSAQKIYVEIAKEARDVATSWGDVLQAHPGAAIAYSMKDDG